MGCPEIALSIVLSIFSSVGLPLQAHCYSASDISAVCQEVLLQHKDGGGAPEHVFSDILDRIPPALRTILLTQARRWRARITAKTVCVKHARGPKVAAAFRKTEINRLGRNTCNLQ